MLHRHFKSFITSLILTNLSAVCYLMGQECPGIDQFLTPLTDNYFYSASSAEGAVGDVVGIDILLTVQPQFGGAAGFSIVGCYDHSVAELLEQPLYSEFLDDISFAYFFNSIGNEPGPLSENGVKGFSLWGTMLAENFRKYTSSEQSIPLATLFFKLKGKPGDFFEVKFCDDEFRFNTGACLFSYLSQGIPFLSNRHRSGTVRIVEGEPTHSEPPPLPPKVKIYPEVPTPESANIHFELTGGTTHPGDEDFPINLYITSNYEFDGFSTSLLFPGQYMELSWVEQHTRTGAVRIDNQVGLASVFLTKSLTRVGAEGQRVHIATLHFKIKETASEVSEIITRIEDYEVEEGVWKTNWLSIRHENGVNISKLPISTEVEPLVIANALLKLQARSTILGDVTLDYQVDISDAIAMLTYLFIDKESILCTAAGDFNGDGEFDISDSIAVLTYLFLDGTRPQEANINCE